MKENKSDVREFIIKKNWQYFYFAPLLAIVVGGLVKNNISNGFIVLAGFYAFSRVNEIFYAFIKDATSHLRSEEHSSTLKYYERIPLAMRSYLELIILYGVIAYILNTFFQSFSFSCEQNSFSSIWQAIYYSGVTITTIGYGEITPNDFFSQAMALYEVINGFSLIVVSFAIYVSRSIADEEYKPKE